jgi:hypothetical protein
VFTLGLALQIIIQGLIFALSSLARCQGFIKDLQELPRTGGRKLTIVRAAWGRTM